MRKLGALVLIHGSDAVLVGNTSLSAVTDIGTGGIGFAPTLRRTAVESSSDWALQISRCFTAMGGGAGSPRGGPRAEGGLEQPAQRASVPCSSWLE